MSIIVDFNNCKESYDPPDDRTKVVARNTIPFGPLEFALKYYPSFAFFCVSAYAPIVAYEFMQTDTSVAGLEMRRNLILLGLWWRYDNVVGVPYLFSPNFFVIQHFPRILSSFGKTGESIRDCENDMALVSLLCIDAPHRVDPSVRQKCAPFLIDAPDEVPDHVLMYVLCLNETVPWELRNEILMTTELVDKPSKLVPRMRLERENEIKSQNSTQFQYATASRLLGAFQFFEQTTSPDPSLASLDYNHYKLSLYHI